MSPQRKISTLALSLLIALALTAPAAQADDTYAPMACVMGPGLLHTWPGGEAVAGDVLSGERYKYGWDPLNLLDVDTGGFEFSSPVTCAGVDVAGSAPTVIASTGATITATGTYDSLICGTGSGNGSGYISGGGMSLSFEGAGVTFVAGAGRLTLNNFDGQFVNSQGGTQYVWKGDGTGYLQIVPDGRTGPPTNQGLPVAPCVTASSTSHTVVGAFEAKLVGP